MNDRLRGLLEKVIYHQASDLHLTVGAAPTLRISGDLSPISGAGTLDAKECRQLVLALASLRGKEEDLLINKECDFSFSFKTGTSREARYRVNAYHTRQGLAAALRRIPLQVPSIDDLNLPAVLHQFAKLSQGFVLFTGPSGCGKSTSIASLIDEISHTRAVHVITIEDPIEYIFSHDQALIDQREIGSDTLSWEIALRSVLREDLDVIFIGEMRDKQTISAAVTMAETGHLVFATLHTNSAAQSADRIIDVFSEEEQGQVAAQLAATLEGVISQRLVPSLNGTLVPACEVLLASLAVRNVIRERNISQVDNIIATSRDRGMVTLERSLADLVR